MVILLDMDGVITDFTKQALKLFGQPDLLINQPDMEKVLGITASEFWSTIDSAGEEFWSSMELLPDALEIINLVERYNDKFIFASSPSLSHHAAAGKILFLQKMFGKNFRRYQIGGNKWTMSSPGYVLIDDFEKNVDSFRSPPHGMPHPAGKAILVPRPWNIDAHLPVLSTLEFWLDLYNRV